MPQQAEPQGQRTGLFVNPAAPRRAQFQAEAGSRFASLALADGAEAALEVLGRGPVDLLVIDLERFDPDLDLAGLAQLVAFRAGAPVLVLCPFSNARWLPALMAHGPLAYAITPLAQDSLEAALDEALATGPAQAQVQAPTPTPRETELAELAALRTRVQAALGEGEDLAALAERLCEALCSWSGVVHAALFCVHPGGDLQLQAQHGMHREPNRELNLARVLGRGERLLQSPLRHAFPGLLAAATNSLALLDAPDKSGEPELTAALRAHGVEMVLGLPIPAGGPGGARGSLCLLFDAPRRFSQDALAALEDVAALAAVGLRLADMGRESEELLARLTHISTVDALTGVANRRHGETLLEAEIKRARRYRLPLALIAFDIDRFKEVNDRYGHPVGDIALRTVAEAAQKLVRSSDIVVRSGGEDFQVIAPHTSAIDGLKMAEKLRMAIASTLIPGCDQVTVSLGVAQLGDQESADSLTVRVNAALARAKRAGRNCVELAMQ